VHSNEQHNVSNHTQNVIEDSSAGDTYKPAVDTLEVQANDISYTTVHESEPWTEKEIGDTDPEEENSEVKHDEKDNPMMYSSALQTAGAWNQGKKSPLSVTISGQNGKKKPRQVYRRKPTDTTYIVGVRREKGVYLYLSNIYTDDKEDPDMIQAVKQYARNEGLRIMSAYVIHNKFCDDVVGCMIRVPVSQIALALEHDIWPEEVECRFWKTRHQ
jgi:hypothetical protein